MKDQRLYAKFTEDFADHPKIKPLSDAAFRALVEMILYSRRMRTDGVLSKKLAFAKWSLDVCQDLLANDPVNPSLIETSDSFLIRDFCDHQTTSSEIEALRETRKAAGRKGGLAKAKQSAKQNASKTVAEMRERDTDYSLTTNVVREKRATRLPDGWMPPTAVIEQMRSEHPHVDFKAEHAKFSDYWHAKAGKDATKVDWAATWRNWIRRASEHEPTTRNGQPIGAATRKAMGWDALRETEAPRRELTE